MIGWRDSWEGTPNVLILAETPPVKGVLWDSLVALRCQVPETVRVTDKAGDVYFVTFSPEDVREAAIITGQKLKVSRTPPAPPEAQKNDTHEKK